jgi:hypothetical protein
MPAQLSPLKMNSLQRLRLLVLWACASASLLGLDAAAEAAPTYKAKTLATGLESPRGVAIAPDGNLVLSEAGRGGTGSCLTSGSGNSVCYGTSGALGLFNFSTNSYSRAITGLPSLAKQTSLYDDATGLNKLTFNGSGQLMGVFGNEGGTSTFPSSKGQWFGQTVSIDLAGSTLTPLANITAFEVSNNPHPAAIDSNPWDLVVSGSDTYVTDAAGNSLVKANSANQVSLVHVFLDKIVNIPSNAPPSLGFPGVRPAQTVPTGLAIGSDGALYIAQLSGVPFAPGSADVFRYDFVNNKVTTFASGFSNLVDIAAGPDNSLYLLQYRGDFWASTSGSILKLGLDGSVETLFSELTNPTALAVAPDGTIYVTNNGNGINGELLQLKSQPVPAPLPIFGLGLAWTQARRLRRRCGGPGLGGSTGTRPATAPAPGSTAVFDPLEAPEVFQLRNTILSWRFYDSFRTDRQAPARSGRIATRTPSLAGNGEDLAAAVQTILEIGDGERVMAKHEIGRRFAPTDRPQGFSTPS